MKKSIIGSTLVTVLLASTLLTSAPLYSMQLNALEDDSSDETESVSSEETDHVQAGSGMRAFFASQVAGARELLGYGRHAAEDLVALMTQSNSLETEKKVETSAVMDTLVRCFLNDEKKYQEHIKYWSNDIRTLFGRYILLNHPLVKVIRAKLNRLNSDISITLKTDGFEEIRLIQFNASGNRALTASLYGPVKIWDVDSGERLSTLKGNVYEIVETHFNSLGNRVATASSDEVAQIWDVHSGKCLRTLRGHQASVSSVYFNRMGNRIITTSEDKTAKVWDVDSGECLCTLMHGDSVGFVLFNEAGNRVITVSSHDDAVKIWDVDSGECLRTLTGHTKMVFSARFNERGKNIITASGDSTAKIWDVDSGECLRTLEGHTKPIYSALFNRMGNKVVTASMDGTAKIWNVDSGECLLTLTGHADRNGAVHFIGGGDRLVTADWFGTVKLWNVESGKCLFTRVGNPPSERFHGLGNKVIAIYRGTIVKILDVEKLFLLGSWFDRECTLEQALLLHCIYETRIAHALLKKRNKNHKPDVSHRFDFNKCPHLQEYFDTMPAEIQACLEPFVIRKSWFRTICY